MGELLFEKEIIKKFKPGFVETLPHPMK